MGEIESIEQMRLPELMVSALEAFKHSAHAIR